MKLSKQCIPKACAHVTLHRGLVELAQLGKVHDEVVLAAVHLHGGQQQLFGRVGHDRVILLIVRQRLHLGL